jgi:hypothetical protein
MDKCEDDDDGCCDGCEERRYYDTEVHPHMISLLRFERQLAEI